MAKRYIKRYYIRPQNVFCSNKAEILNALVKEVGENNCSVYSLKALEDHDDVHLLQPKDIIYYYDDGILYDKNHVKVMDYDLNVKHEEDRKKFGNVDAISDATFDAEYEDRLTESPHYDPADYWDEDPNWMNVSNKTKSPDWDIINKARRQRAGQGYTTYGKASKAAAPSGTFVSIYAACDPQKAKEAFEKHLTEHKLDVRNFHAAYDNILEDEGMLGVFNKDGIMRHRGVYGQIKECKNYRVKAILTKFWVAQFKDNYEIYYGTFGEALVESEVSLEEAAVPPFKLIGDKEDNIEAKREFNKKVVSLFKPLIGTKIVLSKKNGSGSIYYIDTIFVGSKFGDINFKTTSGEQYTLEKLLAAEKRGLVVKKVMTDKYFTRKDNEKFYEIADRWLEERKKYLEKINADLKVARQDGRALARRAEKLSLSYNAVENLSPEEFASAVKWLSEHTKKIKFRVPCIDDDLSKLTGTFQDIEKEDKERTFITKKFTRQEDEFHREFPDAVLGKHYDYRYTRNETDTNYRLWNLSGTIVFDTNIGTAPESIIKLIEKAREIAVKNGHDVKPIEQVKSDSSLNSYYFCWMVFRLFDDDLDFYTKELELNMNINEFDLVFEDINIFGTKVLAEGASSKFTCCICGEESEGYGNNPSPVEEEGKCCDACNRKFVIPARLGFEIEDSNEE